MEAMDMEVAVATRRWGWLWWWSGGGGGYREDENGRDCIWDKVKLVRL